MRSSTEATRLGGVQYAGFVAPNASLRCDSELQTRSEQNGHAVRARFAAVHESAVGHIASASPPPGFGSLRTTENAQNIWRSALLPALQIIRAETGATACRTSASRAFRSR